MINGPEPGPYSRCIAMSLIVLRSHGTSSVVSRYLAFLALVDIKSPDCNVDRVSPFRFWHTLRLHDVSVALVATGLALATGRNAVLRLCDVVGRVEELGRQAQVVVALAVHVLLLVLVHDAVARLAVFFGRARVSGPIEQDSLYKGALHADYLGVASRVRLAV